MNWWKGGIICEGLSLKKVSCSEFWHKGIDSCSDEHKLKILSGLCPVILMGLGFPFWVKILHSSACGFTLLVTKVLLKIKCVLQFTQMNRRTKFATAQLMELTFQLQVVQTRVHYVRQVVNTIKSSEVFWKLNMIHWWNAGG